SLKQRTASPLGELRSHGFSPGDALGEITEARAAIAIRVPARSSARLPPLSGTSRGLAAAADPRGPMGWRGCSHVTAPRHGSATQIERHPRTQSTWRRVTAEASGSVASPAVLGSLLLAAALSTFLGFGSLRWARRTRQLLANLEAARRPEAPRV